MKKQSKTKGKTLVQERKTDTVQEKHVRSDKHVRSGVFFLKDGQSILPVICDESTLTSKAGVQEGKDRGMAPMAHKVVQHAVYTTGFDCNANMAFKTRTTVRDILMWLQLFTVAYSANASSLRHGANVTIRGFWLFEHANRLFSRQPFELNELVLPKAKIGVTESMSWDDYTSPTTKEVEKAVAEFSGIKVYNLKENLLDKSKSILDVLGVKESELDHFFDKRYSGCLSIEVVRANINGDPDRSGAPREDTNGFGFFTNVSLFRKVRDILENKKGLAWQTVQGMFHADEAKYDILEQRDRNRPELLKLAQDNVDAFLDRFVDARVLGNTFLDSTKEPEEVPEEKEKE
jgi:CRISPR/Cas system type I-B associated protein Csh2 (Cas7 group RAMP superfamily)